MIQQDFQEILDQEYQRVCDRGRNVILLRYNNEFSLKELERPEIPDGPAVFLIDLDYRKIQSPFEPFLEVIREMVMTYGNGDLQKFLKDCGVYPLHESLYLSYWETGIAVREEPMLRPEIDYEKKRFREELVAMIREAFALHPALLMINRMQIAPAATIDILEALIRDMERTNDFRDVSFEIILSASETIPVSSFNLHRWEHFNELMDDRGSVISLGTSEDKPGLLENIPSFRHLDDGLLGRLTNLAEFLNTETADYYLSQLISIVSEPAWNGGDVLKEKVYAAAFRVAFTDSDLSQAMEFLSARWLVISGNPSAFNLYPFLMDQILLYMYGDRVKDAQMITEEVLADPGLDPKWRFQFLLMDVMTLMNGWHNIFFFRGEPQIPNELIQGLIDHHYYNHLGYIEVYAFDNDPAKLEDSLTNESRHFQTALSIARKIDNEVLLNLAFEKNIMMASSYGMNHIALYYFNRSIRAMKAPSGQMLGETYSGIGYNLSALGHYERAESAYSMALQFFCRLKSLEDVSEVYYNMSMNRIAMGHYYEAEDALNMCLKIIRHLRLNRIRVCNISKMYGMLSLVKALEGNLSGADQYLVRCENFLSFYVNAEASRKGKAVSDYANYDDDILLYHLSKAMVEDRRHHRKEAEDNYRVAGEYLKIAGGNCYYCKGVYYEKFVDFLKRGNTADSTETSRLEAEEQAYYEEMKTRRDIDLRGWDQLPIDNDVSKKLVTQDLVNDLIEREEDRRGSRTLRRNMEFLQGWQQYINETDQDPDRLISAVMRRFQGYFSVDCNVYIQFNARNEPRILYNNTGHPVTEEAVGWIRKAVSLNPHGLVISKVTSDYTNYMDLMKPFGGDGVCSLVLIPYFSRNHLDYVFMTFIMMRENWFSLVNHYLLDEEDRSFYEVLFREVNLALKRLESNQKIREMNRKLYASAVTDLLTGVMSRNGLFRYIAEMTAGKHKQFHGQTSVMFIDLDNFKPYNDTFGHEAGDLVLQRMAKIFTDAVGDAGVVARYGGDEFILLVATADRTVLTDIAEEIYEEIRKASGFREDLTCLLGYDPAEKGKLDISCSIGIASSGGDMSENDMQELIKEADTVLYDVKRNAKGTYHFL